MGPKDFLYSHYADLRKLERCRSCCSCFCGGTTGDFVTSRSQFVCESPSVPKKSNQAIIYFGFVHIGLWDGNGMGSPAVFLTKTSQLLALTLAGFINFLRGGIQWLPVIYHLQSSIVMSLNKVCFFPHRMACVKFLFQAAHWRATDIRGQGGGRGLTFPLVSPPP